MKKRLFYLLLSCMLCIACDGSDGSNDSENSSDDSENQNDSDANSIDSSEDSAVTDSDTGEDTEPAIEFAWITIPEGEFEMGCVTGDEVCATSELPVRTVSIASFKISETEITQYQYTEAGFKNYSHFDDCKNCPVEYVTWYEAEEYCESIDARLPSEAEWEYVARAGTTLIYGCGDASTCMDDYAWTLENSESETHVVKTKDANDFGVYDMQGNVLEWVADCWHNNYDSAPVDGSAWTGDDCVDGKERVARGGSFGMAANTLRLSQRLFDYPGSYTLPLPGFRCAKDI